MKSTHPITPEDVHAAKVIIYPDCVFRAFNYLIAENFNNNESTFKQKDVVAKIIEFHHEDNPTKLAITRKYIFEKRWLDIETVYANYRWDVKYNKPAFNETYDATFTFTPKP